ALEVRLDQLRRSIVLVGHGSLSIPQLGRARPHARPLEIREPSAWRAQLRRLGARAERQLSSSGCPFSRRLVSTGTGLARAPWVKQLSRATRTRRAILSSDSSDSTSTCTSMPRLPL